MFGMVRRILVLFICIYTFSTPAHAEWHEATSEHFIVATGGSERDAIRLSQRLEAVHWMLTLITGVTPQTNTQRVQIYLVDSLTNVRAAYGPGADARDVAGYYHADATGAVAVVPRGEGDFSTTILFHEYAHHFMLQYLDANFPPWLVEGFAEFVSTASFEREGHISIGKAATHRQYEIAEGEWTPTERMFALPNRADRRAGAASYGQYWLTTHYFLMNDERRVELNRFINALNRGVELQQAYGLFDGGIAALDNELRRYSHQRSFDGRLAQLPANVMASPVMRIMRPGEAAMVPLALQARRNLDENERRALLIQAAALSAQYPDDPAVSLLEARIAFDSRDWPAAEAASARALAIDPANGRAQIWHGWATLQRLAANDAPVQTSAASPARAEIIRGQNRNPDDPLGLIAFYDSFGLTRTMTPEIAYTGILRAVELLPQEDGVRMTAFTAAVNHHDLTRAARLIAPIAYSPHRTATQAHALALLQWVQSGAEGSPPVYVDLPPVELNSD